MTKHVVIIYYEGDVLDVYGPFDNHADALAYAHTCGEDTYGEFWDEPWFLEKSDGGAEITDGPSGECRWYVCVEIVKNPDGETKETEQ